MNAARGPTVRGAGRPSVVPPVRTSRLVRAGGAVYHPAVGVAASAAASVGQSFPARSSTVFSLLGVLGITLVLFVAVVMTAGLILGK